MGRMWVGLVLESEYRESCGEEEVTQGWKRECGTGLKLQVIWGVVENPSSV